MLSRSTNMIFTPKYHLAKAKVLRILAERLPDKREVFLKLAAAHERLARPSAEPKVSHNS